MKIVVRRMMPLAVLLLVPFGSVVALHEIDHRYDVAGYILDVEERPVSGVPVVAQVDGKRMGSGRSDSNGYFRFRLHLHDSDLGRELRLKTPDHEGTVRVSLTPGDTSTERIHHVNFIDGKLVEGELSGRGGVSTSTMVAVGAGLVVIGGVFAAEKMRRRRRRAARQMQRERQGSTSGKRKSKSRRRRKK